MTVIVAVSDGKRVCMAADSLGSNGSAVLIHRNPKIVRWGEFLVGISGGQAMCDFFACYPEPKGVVELWTPAAIPDDLPLREWCARFFVREMRRYLAERELLDKRDGSVDFPGLCLVARGDEFVMIDTAGGISQPASRWWAIGSGGQYARGVLHTYGIEEAVTTAEMRARWAVEAACALDDGCSPPIVVEWT